MQGALDIDTGQPCEPTREPAAAENLPPTLTPANGIGEAELSESVTRGWFRGDKSRAKLLLKCSGNVRLV